MDTIPVMQYTLETDDDGIAGELDVVWGTYLLTTQRPTPGCLVPPHSTSQACLPPPNLHNHHHHTAPAPSTTSISRYKGLDAFHRHRSGAMAAQVQAKLASLEGQGSGFESRLRHHFCCSLLCNINPFCWKHRRTLPVKPDPSQTESGRIEVIFDQISPLRNALWPGLHYLGKILSALSRRFGRAMGNAEHAFLCFLQTFQS